MITDSTNSTTQSIPKNYSGLLVLILVVLILLLGVNIFQSYSNFQQKEYAEERAEKARLVIQSQQTIIEGLITNYQSDAYDDLAVDRISEQQLIATEYQLVGLQILAYQNNEIIQLLADLR